MTIMYDNHVGSYLCIGLNTLASGEVSCCSLYSISDCSAENNSFAESTSKRVHSFKLYARLPWHAKIIVCRHDSAARAGLRQGWGNMTAPVPRLCVQMNVRVNRLAVVRYVTLEICMNRLTMVPSACRNWGKFRALLSHSNFISFVMTPRRAEKV